MAVGDRFKKFDLAKLRTYEKYEDTVEIVKFSPQTANANFSKDIVAELQNSLLEKIENIPVWFEYTKEKQKELVENFFDNKIQNYPEFTFSEKDREKITEELFKSIFGFGKLNYLLQQDNISAVLISGHNVLIEISGKILSADTKLNDKQITFLLKNIYRSLNPSEINNPVINSSIDGYFITVIKYPICTNGVSITIRKQPQKLSYGELIHSKFMPKDIAEFLMMLVQGRKNIIITGTQGCGKTYLTDNILNASLNNSRVAVIEDFAEFCSENEKFSKFSLKNVENDNDFRILLTAVSKIMPEYIVADTKIPTFIAQIIDYAMSSRGNIIVLPALNPEHVLNKSVGLLQELGYSEKLAKTTFLNSIDYIITLEKNDEFGCRISTVTEVSMAKTAAQCLRDIYNVNANLIIKAEELNELKADNSSIRARFTQI